MLWLHFGNFWKNYAYFYSKIWSHCRLQRYSNCKKSRPARWRVDHHHGQLFVFTLATKFFPILDVSFAQHLVCAQPDADDLLQAIKNHNAFQLFQLTTTTPTSIPPPLPTTTEKDSFVKLLIPKYCVNKP